MIRKRMVLFCEWRHMACVLRWGLAVAGGVIVLYYGQSYLEGFRSPAAGPAPFREAAAYSRKHSGLAFLVMKHGVIEYEDYARGTSPKQPLKIYSGTKSFSCAICRAF